MERNDVLKFIPENVFGISKKVKFILNHINGFVVDNNLEIGNLKILDVGCGTGENTTKYLGKYGYSVLGIDTDTDSIQYAQTNLKNDKLSFRCIALQDLSESFDVIICSEVLEHVIDPLPMLLELKKHLKENGILIVTTPNGFGSFEIESFIMNRLNLKKIAKFLIKPLYHFGLVKKVQFNPSANTMKEGDRHVQFFSVRKIYSLFKQANLKVINHSNSTLFGGVISSSLLWDKPKFLDWNAKVADKLPHFLAAGWYFVLKKYE